ncbi:MAG: MarR family transcriptional regulator, partial [Clostridia bacterium]|nr:MarR family transcriptional regulator [Clostridia bacterium]
RRKIHLKIMPKAEPITESINCVREQFLNTILYGLTKEEIEAHINFCSKLFENTKTAIEERNNIKNE